ncbi:hypothetical protein SAMN05421869_102133 [Nonomuraea jiangxiensis]|uniref:Uncharacterized protein n=1 Tax=Nonomuraea jiangxiensis TaxID=633440 RepID=A0A1G8BW86_9ACTN|nr:hypothetical protein SAMN05421869_102133 [Nonomuraea jiangxiensis]
MVGVGHSAATTLLALADLAEQAPGTRITWAIRADARERAYGGGEADALPARGSLGSGLRLLVDKGLIDLAAGCSATERPGKTPAKGHPRPGPSCRTQPLPSRSLKKANAFHSPPLPAAIVPSLL